MQPLATKPVQKPAQKARDETGLDDLREAFTCPISCKIIEDPVCSIYGHLFEKVEIEKWVKFNNNCPVTGKTLTLDDLMPQFQVK